MRESDKDTLERNVRTVCGLYILNPSGEIHFLSSSRNCPADVDVLLSSPLMLTADLFEFVWLCLNLSVLL